MMTQETLREAVAFAIFASGFHPNDLLNGTVKEKWSEWPGDRRKAFVRADAAIATMFERLRTPSEGMAFAGANADAVEIHDADSATLYPCRIWQAMLTAFQQENSDAATDR